MTTTATATPPVATLKHQFIAISESFTDIAIGSPVLQWAITDKGQLMNRSPSNFLPGWTTVPGLPAGHTPKTLDCAADGTAIVVDTTGNAWRYTETPLPGTPAVHWLQLKGVNWISVGVGSKDAIVGLSYDKKTDGGMPQLYLGNGQTLNMLAKAMDLLQHIAVAADKTVVGIAGAKLFRILMEVPPQQMSPAWAGELAVSAGSASTVLVSDLRNTLRLYTGEGTFALIDCEEQIPGTDKTKPITGYISNIACSSLEQYYIMVLTKAGQTTYARVTG